MVDFRKHLSPEAREKLDRRDAHLTKERARYRAMTPLELVKAANHCLDNSEGPHKYPAGEPVYDNAMWHIVLPELLFRLEQLYPADVDIDGLEQLLFAMKLGAEGGYRPGGGEDDCRVWTGWVDDLGYPDPHRSTDVADCSIAPLPKQTGRAIAALLNFAPELIRSSRRAILAEEVIAEHWNLRDTRAVRGIEPGDTDALETAVARLAHAKDRDDQRRRAEGVTPAR